MSILIQREQVKTIETLIFPSYEEAQMSNRWVSRQSISLQIRVNQEILEKYLKFKKRYQEIDKNLLSIAATLSVSYLVHEKYKKRNRKNKNYTSDDLLLMEEFELGYFIENKRAARKEEYLRRKLPLLITWRKLSISYKRISQRLLDEDNMSISDEKIRTFLVKQKEL